METRRDFLKKTALGATGAMVVPFIVPSSAKGANDRITIGMIGTGVHGIGRNLAHYLKIGRCRVVAVCDVDADHREEAKALVNEAYGDKSCRTCNDFRELL